VTLSRRLALTTWALLAGSLMLGVWLAHRSVTSAERAVLAADAAVGREVFGITRSRQALTALLGDRWQLRPLPRPPDRQTASPPLSAYDEAVVLRTPAGTRALAAVYDADRWATIGTLAVAPRTPASDARTHLAVAVVVVILLAVVALWWTRPRGARVTSGVVAALLLTTSVMATGRWAERRLRDATDARITLARRALDLVPMDSLRAVPGAITLVTGLPSIVRGDTTTAVSTLPTDAVGRLRDAAGPDADGRVLAAGVRYAVADVGPVRLVALPYDHSHNPVPAVSAVALIGLLLSALVAALADFADRPRVLRRNLTGWSFLAPAGLHLAAFTVGPLVFAGWLSLHRWSLLDAARPFIGLGNYAAVLTDPAWWNAVKNTAVFTLNVPVSMAVALGLALLVQRKLRGIVALRAVFFLPTITSLVAVAIIWQWMFNSEFGLLNWLLSLVHLGPVPWLTSPRTALPALMLMSVWLVVGYQMVLFQAGLAAIPQDLYDAARIDGAGPWRRFLHVTLPGLRHTLFFVLVTSIIGSFQIFGAVYVMTEGGPLHSTDVAVFHVYEEAWEYFRFGRAAAMSWVLFAIIFVVTWVQFRVVERRAV
jgi:multiple sugar transport system permease protein